MNAYTERQTSGIDWSPFMSDQVQLLGKLPKSSATPAEPPLTVAGPVSFFDSDYWLVHERDTLFRRLYGLSAKTVRSSRAGISNLETHQKQAVDYRASQEAILTQLRHRFVMPFESTVATFLTNHRSLPHLLTEAAERLKEAFGESVILNLEMSTDEDGEEILYGIAICQTDANSAARAFNYFVEKWWLHRMNASTTDIAFVYRLV